MNKCFDINKLPNSTFAFVLYFLLPIRKYIGVALILITLASLVFVVDGLLIRELTNDIIAGNYDGIYWFVLYYFLFWESLNFIWRGLDYLQIKIYPHIKNSVIDVLMDYTMLHSHQYYQNNFAGNISKKISDASMGSAKIFHFLFMVFFRKLLMLTLPLIFLMYINLWVGLVMTAWMVAFLGISIYFSSSLESYASECAEIGSVIAGKVVDVISNIANVRMFARKRYESKYLETYLDTARVKDTNFFLEETKVNYVKGICNSIGIGSLIFTLIYFVQSGVLSTGDFILVMTICMGMTMETWNLSIEIGDYNEQLGIVNQALRILVIPHEIRDVTNAKALKVKKGEIKFENVTFTYKKNDNLFYNKTVTIKAGQKVGLVGFSGSGKSTFVNLITRAFDIDVGRILIDGQDISKITQDSLRANISFIPQDPSLFHRSLMENIKYGKPDATKNDVVKAAKKAHAHDFILETEDQYETLVGERGVKLSGGQRQRIAIARAILKAAPILILDEATSALDSITERIIQESLEGLMKGKTTIVIAHRLSTLLEMDRILVFDKGSIVEDGGHTQLLKKKGYYHKLWHSQVGGFLPEQV
jgi:ATP-binding cassette subfamily B protein